MNLRYVWKRVVRPHWIDLLLTVGVVLLVTYLSFHDRLDPDSGWLDLWPNATTDLIAIWLGVRVIDGAIAFREERTQTLRELRGTQNFIMQRAQSMLPIPDPKYDLRPFEDECRWMRDSIARLQKGARPLRRAEIAPLIRTADLMDVVLEEARETYAKLKSWQASAEAARSIVDDEASDYQGKFESRPSAFYQLRELNAVERMTDAISNLGEPDLTAASGAIAAARRIFANARRVHHLSDTAIAAIGSYLDEADALLAHIQQLIEKVSNLRENVQRLERDFMAEITGVRLPAPPDDSRTAASRRAGAP